MKKKFLKFTLTGALIFLMTGQVVAHDEIGDVSVEKGERTNYENLAVPILERSKNLKFLKEVATPQMKIVREDGKENSYADVYAHKGYAYVGTHRRNGGNGGVRVFDLKDPENPKEVAVFANDAVPGTWQEKVIVKSVTTPYFHGDLAVVSVQQMSRNNPESKGGFLLYDVTNPANPQKLGFWEVTKKTNGTHELYLTMQGNRAVVLAANPYADYYSNGEERDFQIVDVSDPTKPETVWQFDPRTLPEVSETFNGYHWESPDGKIRPLFNHSTMVDETGKFAYVSMWDLGTVIFDIQDPTNPILLGRTEFASNQQGSAHSSTLAKGGTILIETREVYAPVREGYEQAYGYTRIFDIKDKTNPKLLSEFTTDLTYDIPDTNNVTFAKTVHDPKVRGNTLYLSYYAGGVLAVDITDASNPTEIARYTPENSDIWGVFVDRNYILASDIGNGLKVLQKNNSVTSDNNNILQY
ncbi:LVIVD repeat-containing protein [Bacillus sp. SCS-151]|uniref:LVIVD repeat-containing protein n=1 Tax=Nanhaiella sioensis TaxID=3115293 RepID=UPI00397A7F36